MSIKDSMVVQTALDAFESLKLGIDNKTSLHPNLLQNVLRTSIDCPEKPEGFDIKVKYWNNQFLLDKICLTSGGADSTIAWYLEDKPKGLYIDIGQEYSWKEKQALDDIGIDFKYIELLQLGEKTGQEKDWKHIIPGRNFLFLTIAAELVKDSGEIIFAVTDGEGWDSGKGDKSEKFVYDWQIWYKAVTGKIVCVETLAERTKAGWLREFSNQGFDINVIRYKTVTCFSQVNGQCGKCQACLRKYLSFISAYQLDTSKDYETHPVIGCKEYINKYLYNLNKALNNNDFSHYSKQRCIEDLQAINEALK